MSARALAVYGIAAAVLAGAATASAAQRPLRLCADPTNMPFSSNAAEDAAKGSPGLYVEIGQTIAEALGRPMETVWSLSYFGKRNLRTTLLAGQCDLAIGLPAVEDFMGPRVIFSRPFATLGYSLVLPKGSVVTSLDDLKGRKVAVQFASPPQSLLATRDDVTMVTTLNPEDAMKRLAAGEVDAAFVWGPSAGYINHTALGDRFDVHRVDAPQMQWKVAIGFSNKQPALRDEVDSTLDRIAPRIHTLAAKYAVEPGAPIVLAAASDSAVVVAQAAQAVVGQAAPAGPAPAAPAVVAQAAPAPAGASEAGNVEEGKRTFNGTCSHCHGPEAIVADRRINLRRLKLKYGDEMSEVFFKTVTDGRPEKGMPSWKAVFSHQDFVNILAYLKTVQDK
jgi:polar amino acid transport system substrate-binding protein